MLWPRCSDVIGLQEDFEAFCQRLESRFDWDLGERLTVNRASEHDVPRELVERIRAELTGAHVASALRCRGLCAAGLGADEVFGGLSAGAGGSIPEGRHVRRHAGLSGLAAGVVIRAIAGGQANL